MVTRTLHACPVPGIPSRFMSVFTRLKRPVSVESQPLRLSFAHYATLSEARFIGFLPSGFVETTLALDARPVSGIPYRGVVMFARVKGMVCAKPQPFRLFTSHYLILHISTPLADRTSLNRLTSRLSFNVLIKCLTRILSSGWTSTMCFRMPRCRYRRILERTAGGVCGATDRAHCVHLSLSVYRNPQCPLSHGIVAVYRNAPFCIASSLVNFIYHTSRVTLYRKPFKHATDKRSTCVSVFTSACNTHFYYTFRTSVKRHFPPVGRKIDPRKRKIAFFG